jgi:hypothetical protein
VPTAEELEHGFEGITYRLQQLVNSWTSMATRSDVFFDRVHPELRQTVINALVESFLSNARGLAYFLRNNKNDVRAEDYAPGWPKWAPAGPIIGRVAVTVAHPRYTPKPPPWELRPIAQPLVEGMVRFGERLFDQQSPWADRFAVPVMQAVTVVDQLPA